MLHNEDDAKSSYAIDLETKRNYQVEFRKRKLDQSINAEEEIAAYNNYMAEARHRSKLKIKSEKLLKKLDLAIKKRPKRK